MPRAGSSTAKTGMCGSVGKDTDGNASVLFEIDESARKRVLMAVLEDLRHSGF